MDTAVNIFKATLSKEFLQKLRSAFYSEKRNILAQNVCSRIDPWDVCLSRKKIEEIDHIFNHKVEEVKPMTNQKSSGRCWLFAALNTMRIPFVKHFNVEDFEFSQGYLFFWDKIERCNFFLNNIANVTRRKETIDGRLLSFLLNDPISDGGQWDMVVNLITKYGLMPKKCFPESFCCEASSRMNLILKSKLREYSRDIHTLVAAGTGDGELSALIESQMTEIYRIIGICLGVPSETITWTFYDKNKVHHNIGPVTPKQFYEEQVKPLFNVEDKVCLVTDPRPYNSYNQAYTVDCLGNMVGGRRPVYNNQRVELLLEVTTKSIKAGEAVWFGCEVNKRCATKYGVQDLEIHDFPLVFGLDIQTTMTKADRLLYGDSAMTHAMIFTALATNAEDEVTKLRVENSWGEDRAAKGYLLMTTPWFNEFVFEVVVDKKYVSEEVLAVFKQEPQMLPAWDPMGNLAQ